MKFLVGDITPESLHLLDVYLKSYFQGTAKVEPLTDSGVKGRVNRSLKDVETGLIVISESQYSQCITTASVKEALDKSTKVHIFKNDDGFSSFLISKFGKIEGVSVDDSIP